MKISSSMRILFLLIITSSMLLSQNDEEKSKKVSDIGLSGLKFRAIGPALASGRVIDLAVNPNNHSEYYAAIASGGVWKTTNAGTSFSPIFDRYGSYSTGCVTIDPNNTNVVWVGSGENNSQRSVSYGDGVYKSMDGGKSFKNVGLKKSEHIGKIIVHPDNSNVVYVAAQGPLWKAGGDRGLYKTTDGGKNWELILGPGTNEKISENTGVTDIVVDPRNPDLIYAATYQRRRRVWTLHNGGPESGLWRSEDGGKNWEEVRIVGADYIGRIGLAISPANPDYLYALVEAKGGGLFQSTNRGYSWNKQNPFVSSSAQYYQEITCDPIDPIKIYMVSTYSQYSEDGGKTLKRISTKEKHVDDHAIWINPNNTNHWIMGCDGGIYETFDQAGSWRFVENLSITQFYRVTVDNDFPFYNIYGGTQDNNTIGGPTRTASANGLLNQDFYYTVGGDGFKTVVDPTDPNIVYSQPQYGWLVRYDKKSGETIGIQPQGDEDEVLQWNWNSPVLISPHDNKTLYFAANKLFKTTNRGNSWKKVSDDLTRQIDRNQLVTMGKVWDPEVPSKNASTSNYGTIVSLDESPVQQGLLYAGTDDGLVQISEDDGKNWRKISKFVGVPETTYVSDLQADLFDANTVYATFDNRKSGDFTPYILKSTDKGSSWIDISGDLDKENLPVHSIIQDHVNKELLFIGTEFGVYFTYNGGKNWQKLSAGLPTICVKELDIQRRENDLALATFGRGFYVLDDYTPLRELSDDLANKEAHIFPVKDEWMYQSDRSQGRRSRGDNFWRGKNKEYGTVFTYYIKNNFESLSSKRNKKEKEVMKEGRTIEYPSFEDLRKEDLERSPSLIFTIKDSKGRFVRQLITGMSAGINRINWDHRYPDTAPKSAKTKTNDDSGFPVMPGEYTVTLSKEMDGEITQLAGPVNFKIVPLDNKTIPLENSEELLAFHEDAFNVRKTIEAANSYIRSAKENLAVYEKTTLATPSATNSIYPMLVDIDDMLREAKLIMNGDASKSKRNKSQKLSINERLSNTLFSFWYSSYSTETSKKNLDIIKKQYSDVNSILKKIESKFDAIKKELNKNNSPVIPGELPEWK